MGEFERENLSNDATMAIPASRSGVNTRISCFAMATRCVVLSVRGDAK